MFRAWGLGLVFLRGPNASAWAMSMLCIGGMLCIKLNFVLAHVYFQASGCPTYPGLRSPYEGLLGCH